MKGMTASSQNVGAAFIVAPFFRERSVLGEVLYVT
jgi:hypothetical protein